MTEPYMPLRLRMTIQNNILRSERLKQGYTGVKLSKLLGISKDTYYSIEGLRKVPSEDLKIKIAVALVQPIDYLFPEYLMDGVKRGTFEKREKFIGEEVTKKLIKTYTPLLISDGFIEDTEEEVDSQLLKSAISKSIRCLNKQQTMVINLRFGLVDGHTRTLEEVGQELNVSRERVRQIEGKALRKLRQPTRSRILKDFLD